MFDNTQEVKIDNKEIVKAINSIVGMLFLNKDLKKVEVIDDLGNKEYVCPDLIMHIENWEGFYDGESCKVHYLNSHSFVLPMKAKTLAEQLGFTA